MIKSAIMSLIGLAMILVSTFCDTMMDGSTPTMLNRQLGALGGLICFVISDLVEIIVLLRKAEEAKKDE